MAVSATAFQTGPEHQQQQGPVAGLVPAVLGGGNQALDFGLCQVFAALTALALWRRR